MPENSDRPQVYEIPENFISESRVGRGQVRVSLRRLMDAVWMCAILSIFGFIALNTFLKNAETSSKVIGFLIILMPGAILGITGIDGDPVSTYIKQYREWKKNGQKRMFNTKPRLLGTDPVQMDAYGCQLMGLDIDDVPYIRLAEEWGAGSTVIREHEIVRLNEPAFAADYPQPSGKVKRLIRNVQADSACSACFAALVRALHKAEEEGIRIKGPIHIGQGHRGKTFEGLGIGKCCAGADRCVMGCPPTASAIVEQFKEVH